MQLKSPAEIAIMREGGKILASILAELKASAKPGITTLELDLRARGLFRSHKVHSSFLNYEGFPASICTSVNEEIVHGVPSNRVLKEGDLLKIDTGVIHRDFHTDTAATVIVGHKDKFPDQKRMIAVTEEALDRGIREAEVGKTLGDIGAAIQKYVKEEGYDVVRDLVGHGIGRDLHEDPQVPNYGKAGKGLKLQAGMVLAIEPMVVAGTWRISQKGDVFITRDKKLAAHTEHTVAITEKGPLILTR